MKSLVVIWFILFSFTSFKVLAFEKTVFLDLNYVLKESINGKKILNELEILNKKNQNLINDKELILKKKENEILKLKNILTNEEFNAKIDAFKIELDEHNKKKQKIIESFENIKQDKLDIFFDKLNAIMNNYMAENSINLIIDKKSIIMSQNKNDISDEILNLVNNHE